MSFLDTFPALAVQLRLAPPLMLLLLLPKPLLLTGVLNGEQKEEVLVGV